MRVVTALLWILAPTCIFRGEVAAASRSSAASPSTGKVPYTAEMALSTSDNTSGGSVHVAHDIGGISPSVPDRSQVASVPRLLSSQSPGSPLEDDHSLSYDDEEGNQDRGANSGFYDPSISRPASSSPNAGLSPLQRSSEDDSSHSGRTSVSSGSTWSINTFDGTVAGLSYESTTSTSSSGFSAQLQQEALTFASAAAAAYASRGTPIGTRTEGLSRFIVVNEEKCKVAMLFGEAKAARLMGGVTAVTGVIVNHATELMRVVYEEDSTVHDPSMWKRHRAAIRKAAGVVKRKTRTVTVKLPPQCSADVLSRFFTIYRARRVTKRKPAVVQTLVIMLNFRPDPFRVPRTIYPRKSSRDIVLTPNTWVKQRCTYSLVSSRYLSGPPLLRVDGVTGKAIFENAELGDLDLSLIGNSQNDPEGCDSSSPLLCRVHTSVSRNKDPPEWYVELDLTESSFSATYELEVKQGDNENRGMPDDLSGRGMKRLSRATSPASIDN